MGRTYLSPRAFTPITTKTQAPVVAPGRRGCRPPRRANRSERIEFWNRHEQPRTVAGVAPKLAEHEFLHNYLRPHTALDCRTPNEYVAGIEHAD